MSNQKITEIIKKLKTFELAKEKIIERIWYRHEDQKEDKIWAGEYCGICKQKTRPYEDENGLCYCVSRSLNTLHKSILKEISNIDMIENELKDSAEKLYEKIIMSSNDYSFENLDGELYDDIIQNTP